MKNTARAILKDGDDFIFIKRTSKPGATHQEYYVFVGGHVEEFENYEEACIREVKEELGIDIKIEELFFEMYNEEVDRYEKFYLAEIVGGNLGTGDGEEFASPNPEKYGTYEIVKVKKDEIRSLNILPTEVKLKLIELNI